MSAGTDTQKDTLAVAVVDGAGCQCPGCEVPIAAQGFTVLAELFARHRVRRVMVEGSSAFGRAVAIHLVVRSGRSHDVALVEVPTLRIARERRGQVGMGKTDRSTRWPSRGPPPARSTCHRRVSSSDRRRTCWRCRTTARTSARSAGALVCGCIRPDRASSRVPAPRPHLEQIAPGFGRSWRSSTGTTASGALIKRCLERVQNIRRRSRRAHPGHYVPGHVLEFVPAADVRRRTDLCGQVPARASTSPLPNRNTFAAANGTARSPLPQAHRELRYNPGGNRQAKRIPYTIAITPIRAVTKDRASYDRNRAAGRPTAKSYAASNASSPTSSTPACAPTPQPPGWQSCYSPPGSVG